MKAITTRKQTAFRLDSELLDRLKEEAKKHNRSLNNFVESLLMDIVYNEPNEDTKKAIEEAKAGKYAGNIKMTDFESFMKSINEIE